MPDNRDHLAESEKGQAAEQQPEKKLSPDSKSQEDFNQKTRNAYEEHKQARLNGKTGPATGTYGELKIGHKVGNQEWQKEGNSDWKLTLDGKSYVLNKTTVEELKDGALQVRYPNGRFVTYDSEGQASKIEHPNGEVWSRDQKEPANKWNVETSGKDLQHSPSRFQIANVEVNVANGDIKWHVISGAGKGHEREIDEHGQFHDRQLAMQKPEHKELPQPKPHMPELLGHKDLPQPAPLSHKQIVENLMPQLTAAALPLPKLPEPLLIARKSEPMLPVIKPAILSGLAEKAPLPMPLSRPDSGKMQVNLQPQELKLGSREFQPVLPQLSSEKQFSAPAPVQDLEISKERTAAAPEPVPIITGRAAEPKGEIPLPQRAAGAGFAPVDIKPSIPKASELAGAEHSSTKAAAEFDSKPAAKQLQGFINETESGTAGQSPAKPVPSRFELGVQENVAGQEPHYADYPKPQMVMPENYSSQILRASASDQQLRAGLNAHGNRERPAQASDRVSNLLEGSGNVAFYDIEGMSSVRHGVPNKVAFVKIDQVEKNAGHCTAQLYGRTGAGSITHVSGFVNERNQFVINQVSIDGGPMRAARALLQLRPKR